jgi:hypothetical protein
MTENNIEDTILNSTFNPRILLESFSKSLSKSSLSDDYDDVTIRYIHINSIFIL